ncbi:cilia- and flagella-associated protein 251 [Hyla sarda]|uniref:cilia- and flagella-associated protein 251 n=1 Tax=Hyla sarda TaxID=327740 RepID=UPI0024C2EA3E|nr:cilia- and flagella-associated protein 251 [Hyla sarda]XP_056390918.1 cilia- and flagella-associated protein 251 [Hyla sarda]
MSADLQEEEMSHNAVEEDVPREGNEEGEEASNEDQLMSPALGPPEEQEQHPEATIGDFEEQVNVCRSEEDSPNASHDKMSHDKEQEATEDLTDEDTSQRGKDQFEGGNPEEESCKMSDNNLTESQWSGERNNCVSLSDDVNDKEDAQEKAVLDVSATEDSPVYTATPRTVFEDEHPISTDKPLNLAWSFGMNSNIPIYNLHDEEHQVAVYVCAHTAVIHDFTLNRQRHLQGHCSCISSLCVSEDRRWIATGDQGPESLLIVWDSFSGIPVHTIFQSHPHGGVIAIAMSRNAKYLATIGGGTVQKVCIWDWTTGSEMPICTTELNSQFGLQKYIIFNPEDDAQLITNSETQVIFYSWDKSCLEYVAPPLNDETFNKAVGTFSQSVFDFSNVRSLTATSAGKLVVWETTNTPLIRTKSPIKPHNKKALKLMHLQKDAITVLTTHDRYYVTGDTRGHVKFYDQQLQLVNWYSHLNLTPIYSMSFSKSPPIAASENTRYPEDCSIKGEQFAISNFIVSTSDGMVLHVFTDGTMLKKMLHEPIEAVHALACHPTMTQIAVGSYNGLLKVWDYKDRKCFISRIFGKDKFLHCLAYDPKGFFLAAGFTDGSVHILDAVTLEDETKEPFKYAKGSITHVTFSHNSHYLATADQEFTVTLFQHIKQIDGGRASWEYIGRYRSHYKPIQNLIFGIHLDSSEPRLMSLGMDRMLVEYDLMNSSKDHLVIQSSDRIDQSAVPQCLVWYPPLTKESFIFVANNEYKMKLYNATTKMCRKTLLGPTFGSPIRKMEVFPSSSQDSGKGYLAYITDDKVGLQILPVDGNPHKTMALICHPDGVANIVCSSDGQYVFTAGGKDCTVIMWKTNVQSLEAVASLGGEDLIPFYGMLPNGRDGALFKELEDYFYYAQLRNQGIDTMETRQVSTHIPLKEVPFVMRALGYYPTEQEVENMLNEVKFSEYVNTGRQVTHINLGDFIKLYINHRPAFGLSLQELQQAFQVLGFTKENGEQAINRGHLLQLLQTRGEHMTEEELADYLSTLLGLNPEGGSSELGSSYSTGMAELLEQEIPEEITTHMLAADILGLPVSGSDDNGECSQNPEVAVC